MKRLLLRLYPSRWRERYGDEFAAILEERPLGPAGVADVVHGAIDAHLRQSGTGTPGASRLVGAAAIVGGVLWPVGMFGSIFDPSGAPWAMTTEFGRVPWPLPWAALTVGGAALILVALAGLSSLIARRHLRLAWVAVLAAGFGLALSLVAVIGMEVLGRDQVPSLFDAADLFGPALLATATGCILLAIVTYEIGVLSRPAAAALLLGSSVMAGTLLGGRSSWTIGLMKDSWWGSASSISGCWARAGRVSD
jgi:hypothetical protein